MGAGGGDGLKREVGGEEWKCVACQQGAYRRSPAPRTRQTVIARDKVRTETPCANGLSFKENALLPTAAAAATSTPHFTSATFFPPPGESIRSPPTLFEKKKKKEKRRSRTPPRPPSPRPLILLVPSSCLEDSRGHWDSRLWYGLKTSVLLRGGVGGGLAVQPYMATK